MLKLSERGAIHLIILLLLLAGIVGGLYLVKNPQIFKPKAANTGTRIEFFGTGVSADKSTTTSQTVNMNAYYIAPSPSPTASSSAVPSAQPSPQGPTITLNTQPPIIAGQTVSVSWSGVSSPSVRDFIMVSRIGATLTRGMIFTSSCTTTPGTVAKSFGTCSNFPLSTSNISDNFQLDFYTNDALDLTSSAPFYLWATGSTPTLIQSGPTSSPTPVPSAISNPSPVGVGGSVKGAAYAQANAFPAQVKLANTQDGLNQACPSGVTCIFSYSGNPTAINNWKLTDGNGQKTVYAQFLSNNQPLGSVVSSQINLAGATFINLTSTLTSSTATFNFNYTGPLTSYIVDMSTRSDMSWDVYLSFGSGKNSPVVIQNPTAQWDKYKCGATLYWKVLDSTRKVQSPIQTVTIDCSAPPSTPGTVQLTPSTNSPLKNGSGQVTVKAGPGAWSGYIRFNLSGTFSNLAPSTSYRVHLCLKNKIGYCSSSGLFVFSSDPAGNGKLRPNATLNAQGTVSDYDTIILTGGACSGVASPCLKGSLVASPSPTPSPTPTPTPPKAVVMVDSRLYQMIGDELSKYITAAQSRRNFDIKLDNTQQLDDYSFEQIKARLKDFKNQYPSIEGVLFVGNIKMPTFYKHRNDVLQTEIFPAYYEDLDADFQRIFEPGTIDPLCTPANNPNCNQWGNLPVPNHDFDYIAKGPNPYPELWVSLWPVGYLDQSKNNYEGYAQQLRPYLQKLLRFYSPGIARNGKTYYVGNDPGSVRGLWDGYSGTNIDYYSINPDPVGTVPARTGPGQYCLRNGRTPEQCYVRAPTEKYSTYQDFLNFTQTKEWMGENWQIPSIYKSHMQNNTYDFVIVNVHSWAQYSLISPQEARSLSNGGLVMMGLGCNVGEINQPNSSLGSRIFTYANENILLNYLYGQSSIIAVFGDQFYRTHSALYGQLTAFMKHGDYLGQADLKRKHLLYDNSGSSLYNLKDNVMEVLYGDPFMDVSR